MEARHLQAGDVLRLRSGETTRVAAVVSEQGTRLVYNLWVDEVHTYAVGGTSILVHNNTEECAKLIQMSVKGGARKRGHGKGDKYNYSNI